VALKIKDDVMRVLAGAEVNDRNLYLGPPGSLDRKLYTDTNKVLEAIGGKWSRTAGAHVFSEPVADVLDPILLTGEYSRTKQDFGQFDTPPEVVARVMDLTEIEPGMRLLEPSAGVGNLVIAALSMNAHVAAIELDGKRVAKLRDRVKPYDPPVVIRQADFLHCEPEQGFDVVAMNPPFAGQADIDHVTHALKFVKPGGRLVSVMSAAVLYRDNAKTRRFRELIEEQPTGVWEELDAGAFKESGTMVRACIVAVDVR
jgi:predicted RNA methylase